jgi:phytoene dehydrogenase-like protein
MVALIVQDDSQSDYWSLYPMTDAQENQTGVQTVGALVRQDSGALTAWGFSGGRSPRPGLYLCGSGAHPGGCVFGAPGYNPAQTLLQDSQKEQGYAQKL